MTELESPEQVAARRKAHRELWARVKCPDCFAPAGTPCSLVRRKSFLLAGLAHAKRIKLVHAVMGWELNSR